MTQNTVSRIRPGIQWKNKDQVSWQLGSKKSWGKGKPRGLTGKPATTITALKCTSERWRFGLHPGGFCTKPRLFARAKKSRGG